MRAESRRDGGSCGRGGQGDRARTSGGHAGSIARGPVGGEEGRRAPLDVECKESGSLAVWRVRRVRAGECEGCGAEEESRGESRRQRSTTRAAGHSARPFLLKTEDMGEGGKRV